jgi:hypothetical protein
MQERADITPAIPDAGEVQPFNWNPAAATKLLFLSFRHSQGSPEIQQWLFEYTRSAYGPLPLYEQWEAPIKQRLSQAITGFLQFAGQGDSTAGYHKRVSRDFLTFEVFRAYESMQLALNRSEQPLAHERIVYMLSVDLLKKEREYLLGERGRPRGAEQRAGESLHRDSFFSYLRHYGLKHHPTGLVVFDRLYAEIDRLIQTSRARQREERAAEASSWLLSENDLDLWDELLE